MIQTAQNNALDRVEIGDDVIEQGGSYTTSFVGLEVGPRVVLGPIDLLPYVSVGVVDVNPLRNSDDEVEHGSTWDPSSRLAFGYGLTADFYPLPGGSTWLALRARLGGVAPNLGTRQGVDFGGQVGFLTMGIGVFL